MKNFVLNTTKEELAKAPKWKLYLWKICCKILIGWYSVKTWSCLQILHFRSLWDPEAKQMYRTLKFNAEHR